MTDCPNCRAAWIVLGRRRCKRHLARPRHPARLCSVPTCERVHHALGLCARHYFKAYMQRRRAGFTVAEVERCAP